MATKKKESEGVDIFGSAKPKGKSSSAKSDKTVVEVKGLEKKLLEHQWLSGEQANLKTQIDIVKDELKQIGLEKYVELYKDNKSNPNTFLIQDGEGCVMFMPTDKYITIDEARADELIERYGEDAVTVDEKFSFDSKYLERNLEAIKKLLRETKTISDEDKKNLLVKEVKYSVSKGTIDKLYQYGSKMASVLDDIQPVIALKNCGGKMEKGGNMDDLIGYVYEGSEDADEKIIKKVDLYAKGSTIKGGKYYQPDLSTKQWESGVLNSWEVFKSKELAQKSFPKNDILEYSGEDIEEHTFVDNKFTKYAKGSTVKGEYEVDFYGDAEDFDENGYAMSEGAENITFSALSDKEAIGYALGKYNGVYSITNKETKKVVYEDGEEYMAKGGGVKRKTAEEIYEEEQHNAMFNSEYGNGGNMSSGYDYSIGGL